MAEQIPVTVIGGYLGAGKTTLLNRLLREAQGVKLAVLVNDFGSVNIDAALIASRDGETISLVNGCVCCSIGDNLGLALHDLAERADGPDHILIEASGVADPADIVRNLMDPVILREASLETVLCVMDATAPPAALDDALQRSQLRVADIVALSKLDLADAGAGARMRAAIRALRVPAVVVDAQHGEIPAALLFPANVDRAPKPREPGPRRPAEERFETLSWTSDKPVSLPRLQQAINRLAPKLARAKGLFETVEQPGRMMVFQFAAGRATLAPGDAPAPGAPRTRIVFIAELGVLSKAELDGVMEACVAAD